MITAFFNQMPVLVVVVPLLAAPLCVLAHRAFAAWLLYVLASWSAFGMAFLLFVQAKIAGQVSYAVGDWAPPFGIELVIDTYSALVLLLVTGVAALTGIYARKSIASEITIEREYLVFALMLLCLAGLIGITVTGDAFNLFVFLEISSLSSYALIAMGPKRRALLSSFQYLIMGTVGGTFLLIGIGLIFMMTGTLNMADLAERLPGVYDTRTVQAGLAFVVVGLSLKAALMPAHIWLPNAYTYAPSTVSAFIAATATKVAVYALFRFVFTIFGVGYAFGSLPLGTLLLTLAAISMIAGSLASIFQTDVKRLLAWSSVAQMGYIVAGFALASTAGVSAGLVHLLNHGIIKGALFMAVGAMIWRVRASSINDLAGLGRAMPLTSAAFVVGGLSLIGVPATAGFISKWALLSALFEAGRYGVMAVLLVASLLSIIYVGRVIEALYFRPLPDDVSHHQHGEAPLGMQVATWALIAINIAIGVHATPELEATGRAAALLVGGGT
ncbi:monovalent cation/H+ antiporter subunit D family protein [Salinisphaera sp.]|uniref:monovalent cation/H+ antiporter subunit D family protein n=1 Tax=Salinisphaera sp. TaxID=1914330 RepID=UPI000C47C5B7|nr:monovalent cation/H+ antiporter subunit D family protein [Salinisphaera sp.]MAS08478.1 cation:proton antiporter [Salinisphaera sp.]|tara:strand:- start:11550 stop:13046 length:1497 start_codon:yes stop_codon:yes gene_type:complete